MKRQRLLINAVVLLLSADAREHPGTARFLDLQRRQIPKAALVLT